MTWNSFALRPLRTDTKVRNANITDEGYIQRSGDITEGVAGEFVD